MPYIIAENPTVFKEIERQLVTEEITSLTEDCTTILAYSKENKEKGTAAFYIGQVTMMNGNDNFAKHSYQDALTYFQSPIFEKGLAMVFCKLGELYFLQGNYRQASTYISQAIAYAKKQSIPFLLVDAYQLEANIYSIKQQIDSAQISLKKAQYHSTLLTEKETTKNILNQVATNYHASGQLDSAIHYFQKLLLLKTELKDSDGLISDHTALGNLYRERGSYDLAQAQFINGLRLAEINKDSFALMTLYAEIGGLYATQKIDRFAKENHQKSLTIAKAKKNNLGMANSLKELGNLAVLKKNKIEATDYYQEALNLYEQLGNKINAADIQVKLSACYQNDAQYPKAKSYLQEAIAIRQQSKDKLSTLHAKMALAKLELLYGNQQNGITLVEGCLPSFEKMNNKEGLQESYLLLANAYSENNQPKRALRYYKNHSLLKDSLLALERTKVINELEKRYDTEKKDKAILQQQLKIEHQLNKIQRRTTQLLLLGGGLLLTCLLLTTLLFVNKKNRQLSQQRVQVLKKEQEAQHLKTLIEGEEKERKRIGQELHDGLGAVLATVKMQINNIPTQIPATTNNLSYQKAEQLIDEACQTVREISHGMMPYILEQAGLEAAIEDICQTISTSKNLTIHFNPYQVELIQSDTLKITLYRITQELLKNIITHANAQEVIVQLSAETTEIELLVEDDGKGFEVTTAKRGIGLANIQSRIGYLDGRMEIDSEIGKGSTFIITIPLSV